MRKIDDLGKLLLCLAKKGKTDLIASVVRCAEISGRDICASIEVLAEKNEYNSAMTIAEIAYDSTEKDSLEKREYGRRHIRVAVLKKVYYAKFGRYPEALEAAQESLGWLEHAAETAEKEGLKDKAELYRRINKILEEDGVQ